MYKVLVLNMIFTFVKSFHDELIDCKYGMIGHQSTFVLNGTVASIAEFPYAARLYNGPKACGAAILTHRVLVTAAHCFRANADPSKMSIVVGRTHTCTNCIKVYPRHQKYEVCAVLQHEGYEPNTCQGKDIALLLLHRRLELSRRVQPVFIASNEEFLNDFDKEAFVVAGWGRLNLDDQKRPNNILMKTHLSMLSKEECLQIYAEWNMQDAFCLQGKLSGPCKGDSGAGVYYQGFLVGLVSHGKNNGTRQYPAAYTNVLYHKAWIERTMTESSSVQCDQRRRLCSNGRLHD